MKPFNRFAKGQKYNCKFSTPKENHNNKNSKNSKKLTNDDDCPIHGSSHKWDSVIRISMGPISVQDAQTQLPAPICPKADLIARHSTTDSPTKFKYSPTKENRTTTSIAAVIQPAKALSLRGTHHHIRILHRILIRNSTPLNHSMPNPTRISTITYLKGPF